MDVKKLADSLMLELTDEEIDSINDKSKLFLSLVDMLGEIDTSGIEPMTYPFEYHREYLREDQKSHILEQEAVFENAPSRKGDFFKIVQVIDK